MQQRDAGRSFVLGERLQYVLLPGQRTQDEAAEDPLTAVMASQQADFELYWKNKLLRPLSEMFAVCLNPSQLHSLLSGGCLTKHDAMLGCLDWLSRFCAPHELLLSFRTQTNIFDGCKVRFAPYIASQ